MGAFEQIQEAIKIGVTSIKIEDNNIETLPNEISLLTNLTSLEIDCYNLRTIPQEIGQLTNLSLLAIDCYNLATLPKEIDQLVNLKTLNICSRIMILPVEIYHLENLTTFLLSTPLTELPKEIGLLTNLRRLGIGSFYLKALPDEICELEYLTSLEFVCNGLVSPSDDFKKLSKLSHLSNLKIRFYDYDTFSEKVMKLPSEICQLMSLQSLEIAGDYSFFSLPVEIGQLRKLTSLKISSGRRASFKRLPQELCQLINLSYLEIGIDLNVLPEEIGRLVNLRTLHLDCDSIEFIPSGICNLTTLEDISISSYKITALPLEICRFLENVQEINLNLPELEFLSSMKFYNKRTSLNLNFPKLREIPADISELTCVESLEIDCDNLTSLPPEIGQLRNLKSLKLRQGSKLRDFPPEIGKLTSLTSLEIGESDVYYDLTVSLNSLPPEIGQLQNLEILKIICPDMRALPIELRQLSELKRVEINFGGKATTPSPFDFYKLTKLEEFRINHKNRRTLRFLIAGRNPA